MSAVAASVQDMFQHAGVRATPWAVDRVGPRIMKVLTTEFACKEIVERLGITHLNVEGASQEEPQPPLEAELSWAPYGERRPPRVSFRQGNQPDEHPNLGADK